MRPTALLPDALNEYGGGGRVIQSATFDAPRFPKPRLRLDVGAEPFRVFRFFVPSSPTAIHKIVGAWKKRSHRPIVRLERMASSK